MHHFYLNPYDRITAVHLEIRGSIPGKGKKEAFLRRAPLSGAIHSAIQGYLGVKMTSY
jgi:hypothetical protein